MFKNQFKKQLSKNNINIDVNTLTSSLYLINEVTYFSNIRKRGVTFIWTYCI